MYIKSVCKPYLSLLDVINVVMRGISAYNFRQHVASDIGSHGNYLPSENIESQKYLKQITDWTINQKMKLFKEKCKYRVFNFTKK